MLRTYRLTLEIELESNNSQMLDPKIASNLKQMVDNAVDNATITDGTEASLEHYMTNIEKVELLHWKETSVPPE